MKPGFSGYKHTKESRQKMSEAHRGKNHPQWGKKRSEETKKRISEALKGKPSPNKGKKFSPEHKRKISQALTGKKPSMATRRKLKAAKTGKRNNRYGTHHTKETKRKIGLAKKGKKYPKIAEAKMGEKNPSWRGGKSFEPYRVEFNDELKTQTRKHYDYTCSECGYTEERLGYALSCHHIDYDKLNNDPSNLIALCRSCHMKTNFKREDWTQYFQQKRRKSK